MVRQSFIGLQKAFNKIWSLTYHISTISVCSGHNPNHVYSWGIFVSGGHVLCPAVWGQSWDPLRIALPSPQSWNIDTSPSPALTCPPPPPPSTHSGIPPPFCLLPNPFRFPNWLSLAGANVSKQAYTYSASAGCCASMNHPGLLLRWHQCTFQHVYDPPGLAVFLKLSNHMPTFSRTSPGF